MNHEKAIYVGRVLKRVRKSLFLTQEEFSEKIQISQRYYQDLESGKRDLKLSSIQKIVHKLDIFHKHKENTCKEVVKNFLETNHDIFSNITDLNKDNFEHINRRFRNSEFHVQCINTEGIILYCNQMCYATHAVQPEKMIRKAHIADFVTCEQEKDHLKDYLKFIKHAQPNPAPYSSYVIGRDGLETNITVHWQYIRNKNNCVLGYIAVILLKLDI